MTHTRTGSFALLRPRDDAPLTPERHVIEDIHFARKDIGPSLVVCTCGHFEGGTYEHIRLAFDRHRHRAMADRKQLRMLATSSESDVA